MSLAFMPIKETLFPNWFVDPPVKSSPSQKISGDWATVYLYKRKEDGKQFSFDRKYILEISTGDLYGIPEEEPTKPISIAIKCAGIFLATPFYMLGIMTFHSIVAVVDIASVFWKVIPQLINQLRIKPIVACLGNAYMTVAHELPSKLGADIRRIVRSPFFAIGMLFAAAFGVIYPQEGRKWLGQIEYEWHEGASYRQDIRYRRKYEWSDIYPYAYYCHALEGRIFNLGYCMQKRGNIHDKVQDKLQFSYYKEKEKK